MEQSTLTAGQAFIFARNVNDSRIVGETRELCERHSQDPDRVAAITFIPPNPPRLARLRFTVYKVDAEGARIAVYDDGAPRLAGDETTGAWHWLTEVAEEKLKGELPSWWDQGVAAKSPVSP